jgi:hypothetical protein
MVPAATGIASCNTLGHWSTSGCRRGLLATPSARKSATDVPSAVATSVESRNHASLLRRGKPACSRAEVPNAHQHQKQQRDACGRYPRACLLRADSVENAGGAP